MNEGRLAPVGARKPPFRNSDDPNSPLTATGVDKLPFIQTPIYVRKGRTRLPGSKCQVPL